MHDIGDVVTLTYTTRDASNNPADDGTATCTITLPDQTTTSPAVSHTNGTGVYTVNFAVTQAGRHLVRFVSSTNGQTDVFWAAAADPGLIISLAEARASMRTPGAYTADDEDLRSLIASATLLMEDLCGPIVPRSCDEWQDGGTTVVALDWSPLISVTSVAESYGNFTRTLTAQDLGGSSFDAYGYTVDLTTGILTRRYSGSAGVFAPGRSNIHVVYTAGRTTLPAGIVRGTRRLVRWLAQTELQGQRPQGSQPEEVTQTPSGWDIPRAVVKLCGREVRVQAIR